MKRYTAGDVWQRVRVFVQTEIARGIRNPLTNPSFFDTDSGYRIEQALLDVEERCRVTAYADGQFEIFYDMDDSDAVVAMINRNAFWDAVLKLVLDSSSQEAFERNYEMYLGTKFDQ